MDPDANLKEQLEITDRLHSSENQRHADIARDANRLAELVESLNDWIVGGGFLPRAWSKAK